LVVKETLPSLGPDILMVSIDVDTTENADQLRRFADDKGFGWRFAIAPATCWSRCRAPSARSSSRRVVARYAPSAC